MEEALNADPKILGGKPLLLYLSVHSMRYEPGRSDSIVKSLMPYQNCQATARVIILHTNKYEETAIKGMHYHS